ncbi:MAG: MFS transporter [Alphaproteobacteria bacterium]|nr:MFS transporter [Alphaproteobacteria bacterium]
MAADRHEQRLTLAATSVSYVVVILDTSIVNVSLPPIGASLSAGLAGLQWVVNAYTLSFACLLLTGGTLGDRFGARRVYMAGLAVFTAASLLCGVSLSLAMLIGARVLQGLGASLLVPCSLTLLNNAYPDQGDRAKAIGYWAGWGGVALAAGPLAGGLLVAAFGWRSIFLVNVPIGLAGIWLTARIAATPAGVDAAERHLDLSGQIAGIVALGTLIGVLIEGPVLGWDSALILAGVAVSACSTIAFLAIEAGGREPMMPLGFFRNPVFSASAFVAFVGTLTFFGLIFALSLYFQQERGYSPLWTGLAFLPATAVVTGGNAVSGALVKQRGARLPVLLGLAVLAVGLLGLLPIGRATPYLVIALPLLAVGLGGGLVTPAATAALMAAADRTRAGIAAGILNTSRQVGAAMGVALFGLLMAGHAQLGLGVRIALLLSAGLAMLGLLAAWRALPSCRAPCD